jgi:4-amino-4-deoxy-L-arabinose transferase-like glycosyltransferase
MTSQPPGETAVSTAQRIGWAILIVVTLYICYFSHLGVIGFVGPDEPRYAWIARDMAETGDWVTPRLYGKPWFEKPPLLYWGGAIFFKLFGSSVPEVAARLPSAISALLATLALAWLAWRTYGEECARWLLLLLPTSVGMIGFSHAAATDMPFAGMLTIAMICAAVALGLTPTESTPILPRTEWLALVLFGFFLGLAVLAKGPAAIILSGGSVFFWAIFTKRWRDAFRLLHPAAITSFCLTALPWYILCARRNPNFFRIFIIEHNFKRYLTPEFQHVQPFWFYVLVLLVAFLPWTVALVGATISGIQVLKRRQRLGPTTALLVCWSLFYLVFFTISRSKLPGYILPAIPTIGLLFSRTCDVAYAANSRLLSYFSLIAVVPFVLASGAAAVVGHVVGRHAPRNGNIAVAASVILFLFAIANLFLSFAISKSNVPHARLKFLVATGAVLPILIAMLSLPKLLPYVFTWNPSAKTVAQEIASHRISPSELLVWNMNRGMHFSLNFYLKQEIPDWNESRPTDGYLLLHSKNCEAVVPEFVSCEEPPLFLEKSERFLYRVKLKTSLDRLDAGREPR